MCLEFTPTLAGGESPPEQSEVALLISCNLPSTLSDPQASTDSRANGAIVL